MTDKFIGFTIFADDFRHLGYCSKGVRLGFKRYGLSYSDFISSGIDAAELLIATDNNEIVLKVVEAAYERR